MDNEKRLLEIEAELEAVRLKIHEMELNDPTVNWTEFSAYMQPVWNKQARLDREKRMVMTPEYRDREIDVDDDVMSLKDFIEAVNQGCFIDYDGYGKYVKDGKISDIRIHPSDIQNGAIRDDFDTIIWFNK